MALAKAAQAVRLVARTCLAAVIGVVPAAHRPLAGKCGCAGSNAVPRTCRNLQDISLPSGVDVTSIRLLLNLVEVLLQRRSAASQAADFRPLIGKILAALVSKLASLRAITERLLEHGAPAARGMSS